MHQFMVLIGPLELQKTSGSNNILKKLLYWQHVKGSAYSLKYGVNLSCKASLNS